MTNVTDRGGGNGGGWGESQDEFKRRVMGKKRDFSVTSCISFISSHRRKLVALTCLAIPCGSEFYQNIISQPPTPQQQQASVPIAKTDIDSAFDRAEELLKKLLVRCIVEDSINYYFMENYKPSDGWQCAMDALQNQSR